MLHPRQDYQAAKQRYAPFNRLVDADPETRGGIVSMLRDSRETKIPTYVIVNNKAEGSSPLSILAMVEELVRDDAVPVLT